MTEGFVDSDEFDEGDDPQDRESDSEVDIFNTLPPLDDSGPEEASDVLGVGRDSITGLSMSQTGYEGDPAPRTDPITAFMDDEHSEGIYKQPQPWAQTYPTTDPRPA